MEPAFILVWRVFLVFLFILLLFPSVSAVLHCPLCSVSLGVIWNMSLKVTLGHFLSIHLKQHRITFFLLKQRNIYINYFSTLFLDYTFLEHGSNKLLQLWQVTAVKAYIFIQWVCFFRPTCHKIPFSLKLHILFWKESNAVLSHNPSMSNENRPVY